MGQLVVILLLFLLPIFSGIASGETDEGVDGGEDQGDRSSSPPPPPAPSSPPPPPPTMPPPPPSPTEGKNASADSSGDQATEKTDSAPAKEEPPPSTGEDVSHPPPEVDREEEDSSHCCGAKVHACLSSPGDSSNGMLSLVIKSREVVGVKVTTPSFLSADPSELTTTADAKPIQVKIEMVDPEAAKLQSYPKITISSDLETCDLPVPVPSYNPGYGDKQQALLVGLRTPVAGLGMMAAAIAVVVTGFWACHRCRGSSKRHATQEPRYVELEMGIPERHDEVNVAGSGGGVEADDEWDKVWDGDWDEESETVANSPFKLTESLSGKGLAARRSAKEGRAD